MFSLAWKRMLLGTPIAAVRLMPKAAAAQDDFSPEAIASRRGLDLRLLPIAFGTWAFVALTVVTRSPWPVIAAVVAAVAAVLLWKHALAATTAAVAGLIAAACYARLRLIDAHPWVRGTIPQTNEHVKVQSVPRQLPDGGVMVLVDSPHAPGDVPLFFSRTYAATDHARVMDVEPGQVIDVAFRIEASDRAAMIPIVLRATRSLGEPLGNQEAQGLWGLAAKLRSGLHHAAQLMPAHTGDVVPGMVVGDTTAQSQLLQDQFMVTGLSHLSAVSGANCAIVMGTAMLLASMMGAARWGKLSAAVGALLGFVALVGPEPSVLRAAVMGSIGLAAVATSLWRDIVASACWAVLVLLLWDPGLALSYGFLLSLVATGGIILLAPWWSTVILGWWWGKLQHRGLRPPEWHGIFVRIVCVSVAADMVTAPVIMHMAGRFSLVAIFANIAVAWAVPVVTIVGLLLAFTGALAVAFPLAGASDILVTVVGWVAAPGAGWIITVAQQLSRAPLLTAPAGTITAAVMAGLVACAILSVRWRRHRQGPRSWVRLVWGPVLVCAVGLWRWGTVGVEYLDHPWAPGIFDAHGYQLTHVNSDDQAILIPAQPGTLIINDSCGPPTDRPTITPAGNPVIYPCRDNIKIME